MPSILFLIQIYIYAASFRVDLRLPRPCYDFRSGGMTLLGPRFDDEFLVTSSPLRDGRRQKDQVHTNWRKKSGMTSPQSQIQW